MGQVKPAFNKAASQFESQTHAILHHSTTKACKDSRSPTEEHFDGINVARDDDHVPELAGPGSG